MVRPPDEHRSLPVPVTTGCSYNGCTFCNLYRDQSYSVTPLEIIHQRLQPFRQARAFKRVFLGAGDAFSLPSAHLLQVLSEVRDCMPWVSSVGIYAISRLGLQKSTSELEQLRQAGITRVYHGLESGADEILRQWRKPACSADALAFARRLTSVGIWQEVTILLGVGSITETGRLLGQMKPDQVRGIPLGPTSPEEVRRLVKESGLPADRFRLPAPLRLALHV